MFRHSESIETNYNISLHANLLNKCFSSIRSPPLTRAPWLSTLRLGISLHAFKRLIDSSRNLEGTRVFPKLNSLTNHNRLVLDMQIIMPRIEKLGAVSTCRERQ